MKTRSRDRAGEGVADRAALARRVVRDNALAIGAANVVGGVLVGVFLIWVVPVPVSRGLGKNLNLILAASYLTAASIAGQMLGRRTGAPVLAWLRAGRQPTPHEREVTLRQQPLPGAWRSPCCSCASPPCWPGSRPRYLPRGRSPTRSSRSAWRLPRSRPAAPTSRCRSTTATRSGSCRPASTAWLPDCA